MRCRILWVLLPYPLTADAKHQFPLAFEGDLKGLRAVALRPRIFFDDIKIGRASCRDKGKISVTGGSDVCSSDLSTHRGREASVSSCLRRRPQRAPCSSASPSHIFR